MQRTIGISAAVVILFFGLMSNDDATVAAKPEPKVEAPQLDLSLLGDLEDSISSLETRVTKLEGQVCDCSCGPDCNCGKPEAVAPKPKVVQAKPKAVVTKTAVSVNPKWLNTDGRSLQDHMVEVHGFSQSMDTNQMIIAHDAWHDQNGGGAPAVSKSRTVTYGSSCPSGVCPAPSVSRSRTVQRSGGLLGFGILGRRR